MGTLKNHRIRRGASNTSTIVIIVVIVGVVGVLLIGCLAAGFFSVMLPAVTQARDTARDAMSTARLAMIDSAYHRWHIEAGAEGTFSFDSLVAMNFITADMLVSPHGPVADAGGDYWYLVPRPEPISENASTVIVGYDRAMYARGGRVAVLFADSQVELLELGDFQQRIASPPNEGVDFNLPAPAAQPLQ
jgi:hypothetical protein